MEINKELWTLEVSRCDTDVVFSACMVEFGKTPIDQP